MDHHEKYICLCGCVRLRHSFKLIKACSEHRPRSSKDVRRKNRIRSRLGQLPIPSHPSTKTEARVRRSMKRYYRRLTRRSEQRIIQAELAAWDGSGGDS